MSFRQALLRDTVIHVMKLSPQPHSLLMFGLLKTNLADRQSSCQSMTEPMMLRVASQTWCRSAGPSEKLTRSDEPNSPKQCFAVYENLHAVLLYPLVKLAGLIRRDVLEVITHARASLIANANTNESRT